MSATSQAPAAAATDEELDQAGVACVEALRVKFDQVSAPLISDYETSGSGTNFTTVGFVDIIPGPERYRFTCITTRTGDSFTSEVTESTKVAMPERQPEPLELVPEFWLRKDEKEQPARIDIVISETPTAEDLETIGEFIADANRNSNRGWIVDVTCGNSQNDIGGNRVATGRFAFGEAGADEVGIEANTYTLLPISGQECADG
ncbi:hypothetical protein G352_24091 [Rhodococcus ruber BKS 20-38]|uniref:Uncharacterized protein n=1 Tax=Rhodococcus ruber BKS 20-38 TaxID=1278076 RepID=M2WYF7_9NOCA|nr:hypothetical protein [Rhodococcus ruber]EME53776.1 hypothetical protein G352_24091 [Rhodococcus ruber BKS 20-38]